MTKHRLETPGSEGLCGCLEFNCCLLEILNNFFFGFVFYKWDLINTGACVKALEPFVHMRFACCQLPISWHLARHHLVSGAPAQPHALYDCPSPLGHFHILLPRWFSGNECACSAGDMQGSIPESGRSPRGGHGNPLQYSCLGNPMYREAWWSTVQGVTKSQTGLSNWTATTMCQNRLFFFRSIFTAYVRWTLLRPPCISNAVTVDTFFAFSPRTTGRE